MLTDVLFPAELQLRVDGVEMEKNTVNISVASTNGRSICPHCQTISERIHSSYSRHPADLPLADYTVRLGMAVHRFFCDNHDCSSVITMTVKPGLLRREYPLLFSIMRAVPTVWP